MRLGEILVQDRLITPAQLESALQAQMLYGARLGTSLVELGFLDLDGVARALGKQHGVPAALQRHFDAISPSAVRMLPARLAERTLAVPLGVIDQGGRKELWVALVDPQHPTAEKEIAFATGARVMVTVAPELRVHFQLERLYRIQRDKRFMRVSAPSDRPRRPERRRPAASPLAEARRDEVTIGSVLRGLPAQAPAGVVTAGSPASGRPAPNKATLNGPMALAEAAFRRVGVVAPGLPVVVAAAAPSVDQPPGEPPASAPASRAATSRSTAPRTSPAGATAPAGAMAALAAGRPALSAADTVARLAAPDVTREEVGDLIVDHLRSAFGAGVVFIVRQDLALGWKGFAPGVDASVFGALSVPLGTPSSVQLAHERAALFRGAPPSDGALLDGRLWKLLKSEPPREVAVLPIVIGSRLVNLIYVHALGGGLLNDATLVDLSRVAVAAGDAFLRLIGQKTRG